MSLDRPVNCSVTGGEVVPHFLGEHDHPWLRSLLEEYDRFVGRPHRELAARLRQPLPREAPPEKLKLAVEVLMRAHRGRRTSAPVPPRRARAMVFTEAARAWEAPLGVLSTVATSLGVTVVELRDSLFADLPGERLVDGPPQPVSAMELALRTNLAVVQRLLFRATTLRIEMEGHARPVVRHAKWRGLICTIVDRPGRGGALLEISGPFALFRNTRLYGHALGQLLPLLVWCSRFRLEADCFVDGRRRTLQLATGDPIFPAAAPRQYDSRIEESFAREFRRAAPDWDVVREPEPIAVDRTLVFPDFLLQRRSDPGQRWLLEIVGFWTPDYISRKFALYRRALVANLILCIDEARSCADGELPPSAKIIRFRRRVDPAAVLQAVGVVPPPAWNSSKARHADTTRSISG